MALLPWRCRKCGHVLATATDGQQYHVAHALVSWQSPSATSDKVADNVVQ